MIGATDWRDTDHLLNIKSRWVGEGKNLLFTQSSAITQWLLLHWYIQTDVKVDSIMWGGCCCNWTVTGSRLHWKKHPLVSHYTPLGLIEDFLLLNRYSRDNSWKFSSFDTATTMWRRPKYWFLCSKEDLIKPTGCFWGEKLSSRMGDANLFLNESCFWVTKNIQVYSPHPGILPCFILPYK